MPAHEFLLDTDDPTTPVAWMAQLRTYVEDLPPTSALWKPSKALPDVTSWGTKVPPEMLWSLGSWPAPAWIAPSSTNIQYVNPNHVHVTRYSDVVEACDCGYQYGLRRGGNIDSGALSVHAADCSETSRMQARGRLRLRRIAWLKQQGLLKNRQPVARKRLGFTTDTHTSRLYSHLPESYYDWYGRGKQMAANTMTILRGWGVDAQLIADAYGVSRHTVYTYKSEADREYVASRAPLAFQDYRKAPATARPSSD